MPAPRSAPENPTHGLTAILGDHDVAVTGEEFHQPALQTYAPRADGRSRRVAVELVPAPIARGTHAGKPGVEVRLDGRRIGELTHLMAQRYGPLVVDVLRRGGRPSCIGLVRNGKRGLEVVLQLPDVRGQVAAPAPASPTMAVPAPRRSATRTPAPAQAPTAPARRRARTPLLIGGAVVALLVVIGASMGGRDAEAPTDPALAAAATAPPATSAVPTTTPAPTTAPAVAPQVPPPPPPPRETQVPQQAARQLQPQPEPQPQPQPRPQPQPQPRQQAQPPQPASDCNSNYSGCVPNASDVDCAGGTGNGPAYLDGTARVIGDDVYDLDRDGDGTACEKD